MSLLEDIAGDKPLKILDYGTGTGYLAILFARLGHTVTGVDVSSEMIAIAKEKAKSINVEIEFYVDNIGEFNLKDSKFDLICSRMVLWTLPQPTTVIRNLSNQLKPGGRLISIDISGPVRDWQPYEEVILQSLPLWSNNNAGDYFHTYLNAGLQSVQITDLTNRLGTLTPPNDPEQRIWILSSGYKGTIENDQ